MTEIQELANLLHAASPELELNLDCPGEPGAPCWLDVSSHDHFVAVEWRPALGFGVSRVDTASAPRAGLFVQLDELFVDGLVPIRTMADDYYVYEADAHRLVGSNHRRVFQLAGEVEVELAGVSLRHRGLDFKLVGMPEPQEREGRRGKEPRGEPRRGRR